jgi:hypothetical protein
MGLDHLPDHWPYHLTGHWLDHLPGHWLNNLPPGHWRAHLPCQERTQSQKEALSILLFVLFAVSSTSTSGSCLLSIPPFTLLFPALCDSLQHNFYFVNIF